jgi:hypothetical protein
MRDIVSPLMGLRSPFGGRVDQYKAGGFRPTLVADMTRDYYRSTSRQTFDDLFTHSRLGNATMVDSDGLLKWGPHNLQDYSEDLASTSASVSNVTISSNVATAPDGSATADKLVSYNGTGVTQWIRFLRLGPSDVDSVWRIAAKADGFRYITIGYSNTGSYNAEYDLQNGVVSASPAVGNSTASITEIGDGWYWLEYAYNHAGSIMFISTYGSSSGVALGGADTSIVGDGSSGVLLWGNHQYRSDLGGMAPVPPDARVAGSTTYVPTTSTAKYLPRRHNHVYNGTAWVDAGTLIETEARTNLVTYSEVMSTSFTVTSNATISDGSGFSTVTDNAVNDEHFVMASNVFTPDGAARTWAVDVKGGSARYAVISHANTLSSTLNTYIFDTTSGVFTATTSDPAYVITGSYFAIPLGDGWYRIGFSSDLNSTSYDNFIIGISSGPDFADRTYAGSGDTVLFRRPQLEAASTPSSYIPTSGSTVTRAADTSGLTIPAYSTTRTTGSELVTNGTFDSDVSGWTDGSGAGGSISWNASGYIDLVNSTGVARTNQSFATVVGKTYIATVEKVANSSGINIGTTVGAGASNGDIYIGAYNAVNEVIVFVATSTTTYIGAYNSSAGVTASIDNISVKEAARIAPWPTPRVIGEELVTNGGFDADSDWTKGAGWTISGGVATKAAGTASLISQSPGLSLGKVYQVSFTVSGGTAGTIKAYVGSGGAGTTVSANGTYTQQVVCQSSLLFSMYADATFDGSIDNISVKEIDPLSVSIQMEGTMTYADTNQAAEAEFFHWQADTNNRIQSFLRTNVSPNDARFQQGAAGVFDTVDGGTYSPGVNVPFNIASRHGSTFVNGAVGGTALTADTTPTALPDLSSTDLQIAYDFMGNIEQVRIWTVDIGDTGIAEASNG